MVDKTQPPLWIRPQPSRRLQAFLMFAHALAACAIPLSGLALPYKLALLGLLCLSLGHSWWRHVLLRGRTGLRQLCWEADGRWLLQDGRGDWRHAETYRAVWVNPKIILVHFGGPWRPPWSRAGSLLLLPDAVAAELHRRLRVRLCLQPRSRIADDEGM